MNQNITYPDEDCKSCINIEQLPDSHPCTCCQCPYHPVNHYIKSKPNGGL